MSETKCKTISDLAAEALKYFKRGDREAAGIGKIFIHLDNCPQWVIDMCHSAHGDMMPDDWRYEFINDCLSHLSDNDNDDDSFNEWLDGAYCYYHEHLAWLASRNDRMCYCDDAVKEYGDKVRDMNTMIKMGMDSELREVFWSVLASLKERLDDEADENDDEDTN